MTKFMQQNLWHMLVKSKPEDKVKEPMAEHPVHIQAINSHHTDKCGIKHCESKYK